MEKIKELDEYTLEVDGDFKSNFEQYQKLGSHEEFLKRYLGEHPLITNLGGLHLSISMMAS